MMWLPVIFRSADRTLTSTLCFDGELLSLSQRNKAWPFAGSAKNSPGRYRLKG